MPRHWHTTPKDSGSLMKSHGVLVTLGTLGPPPDLQPYAPNHRHPTSNLPRSDDSVIDTEYPRGLGGVQPHCIKLQKTAQRELGHATVAYTPSFQILIPSKEDVMEIPTPIMEEPPTPMREAPPPISSIGYSYQPIRAPQLPHPSQHLRTSQDSQRARNSQDSQRPQSPDYFTFTNPFDNSSETITLLPHERHPTSPSHCSSCTHQKKTSRPLSIFNDLSSAIFIFCVVIFLLWAFIAQLIQH
ncbi:hypothetical protein MMC14_000195 [Varicellaria rhodocarpa]|nr:hypothetical protein [Varicellaria rhodocarpa]